MKMTRTEFADWKTKRITLLGMSGVGKTTLANKLPMDSWFHYSGDYRIGTKYLEEPILDNIKRQAMGVPFLRELLLSDSIYICSNITVDNLTPVSTFLGKLGDPKHGGLTLSEFKRRQAAHRQAEISAMRDVPSFIEKAQSIYGYMHFINDAGGSLCEIDDPATIQILADHTLILYIKSTSAIESMLSTRAQTDPKPLYYREEFLDAHLPLYMAEKGLKTLDEIPPDDFVVWVFPRLLKSRIPRYQAIADQHGYSVGAEKIEQVRDANDFLALLEEVLSG